jgi:hypothetical protein
MNARKGPIESRPWPEKLEAFAVESETPARLFGYDVEDDLARHYRFSDVVYLALTGELPDDARGRAFEIVLVFLVPAFVGRGAMHAAVLTAHCGAPPSGQLGTAATGLAGDALVASAIEASLPSAGDLPMEHRAGTAEEAASVARLAAALKGLVDVPLLSRSPHSPRRDLALVAALRACGIDTPARIAAAFALARLPSAHAEAERRSDRDFADKYPMNTPPFTYVE